MYKKYRFMLLFSRKFMHNFYIEMHFMKQFTVFIFFFSLPSRKNYGAIAVSCQTVHSSLITKALWEWDVILQL